MEIVGGDLRRGPGRPRSAEADQSILAATVTLLAGGGYGSLTMEKVASMAGVGKATVYRRWSSKVELVVDAIRASIADVDVPDTGSLREDLVAFLRGMIGWVCDSDTGRMMAGMSAEIQHNAELAEVFRSTLFAPRRAVIRRALTDAVARGELRSDIDIEVVLDVLSGPLFLRKLISGMPIEPGLADQVVDILLNGAAAPGS
jgi:AcrR family transcriptional regulator